MSSFKLGRHDVPIPPIPEHHMEVVTVIDGRPYRSFHMKEMIGRGFTDAEEQNFRMLQLPMYDSDVES